MKYNAFRYLDDLKEAGVPSKQAEVMAKGMTEFAESELATKRDIEAVKSELKRDIKELELKIKASENAQTLKLTGIMAALLAIFRFLPVFFK